MALTATFPPSRVATQVRVRLADLKKQMAARPEAPAVGSPLPLGCVEGPPGPARPQPTGATQIELSRTDGTRLCIDTPLATLPLDALVRACVEGRSGCNCPPKAGSVSPRNPWISAKALMDWQRCVDRCWGSTRWRVPSTSSATARAPPSSSYSMTGRGIGCACNASRQGALRGGLRPSRHGCPCRRGS